MSRNAKIGNFYPSPNYVKLLPDDVVLVEAAIRRNQPLSELIKPNSPSGQRISLKEWKMAEMSALNVDNPDRNPMLRVYNNVEIDNTLTSIIETRILRAQQAKFNLVDQSGTPNDEAKKLLERKWFRDFIKYVMTWNFRGYQLIEIFDFDEKGELKTCDVVNEFHVKPDKGIVTVDEGDEKGYDYLSGNQSLYYIPVGKPKDLGLLHKVAPHVLAKKFALGHWGEYNEKIGIPFRTVTQKNTDSKRQKQLGEIMRDMGAAGWAVLQADEVVQLLESKGTDPTKCFEGLINMLNAEAAMLIMGQSSTANSSKEKGTYGSLKVLHEITRDRHEYDLTNLKDILNDVLFPRLAQISSFYRPLANLKLEWDYSEELSVKEIVEVITQLLNTGKYNIRGEVVTKKVGFEVLDAAEPTNTDAAPVPDPAKKKSLSAKIEAHYTACCANHATDIKAINLPDFEDIVLKVAKKIFNKTKKGVLDLPLLKKTALYLREAIVKGYGSEFNADQLEQRDKVMMKHLDKNVFYFSGFKTYQQLKEISALLKDGDGNFRPWDDFKAEVLKVNSKYNVNWLKAEYEHVVVGAQACSQWQEFQRNKEDLPFLIFDATNDNRTTPICLSLDGFTARVDDPVWDTYYLPLHFGERSVIRSSATGVLTDQSKVAFPDLQPMFQGNIGKTGVAFPESHPYYEESIKRKIKKEVDKNYEPEK